MIIVIFLNYLFFYFIKKHNIFPSKKAKILLAIGLLLEIIIFILYRLSLSNLGREVYYSDAETYWRNTLEIITTGHSNGYNKLYYYICALIQITSPFIWVGWNNLFNITCVNLTFLLSAYFIKKDNKYNQKIQIFTILALANPFIIYGLMRNLKDALFTLMMVGTCAITSMYFKITSQKARAAIIATLLCLAYLFTDIRPWGFIIPVISILYIIWQEKRQKYILDKRTILALLLVVAFIGGLIVLSVPAISNNIKIWAPITLSSFSDRGIVSTIFGFGKFILAPGPLRAFLGVQYFEHSIFFGNIAAGIGEIMWWLSLLFMLIIMLVDWKTLKALKSQDSFTKLLSISLIIYTIIYTVQYGGSGEIRLKSVLYILVYAVFFQVYNIPRSSELSKHKSLIIIATIILSGIFVVTSIFSTIMES